MALDKQPRSVIEELEAFEKEKKVKDEQEEEIEIEEEE